MHLNGVWHPNRLRLAAVLVDGTVGAPAAAAIKTATIAREGMQIL